MFGPIQPGASGRRPRSGLWLTGDLTGGSDRLCLVARVIRGPHASMWKGGTDGPSLISASGTRCCRVSVSAGSSAHRAPCRTGMVDHLIGRRFQAVSAHLAARAGRGRQPDARGLRADPGGGHGGPGLACRAFAPPRAGGALLTGQREGGRTGFTGKVTSTSSALPRPCLTRASRSKPRSILRIWSRSALVLGCGGTNSRQQS